MPPKRSRRASPAAQGLSAGERLKRTKLGHDQLAWAWVGTEVTNAAHITQENRLATCGFSDPSVFPFCANKYAKKEQAVKDTRAVTGELDDDIIIVSDDESPNCSSKTCKNNPNCLNYLGQEKWENPGSSYVGTHPQWVLNLCRRKGAGCLPQGFRPRSRPKARIKKRKDTCRPESMSHVRISQYANVHFLNLN